MITFREKPEDRRAMQTIALHLSGGASLTSWPTMSRVVRYAIRLAARRVERLAKRKQEREGTQ